LQVGIDDPELDLYKTHIKPVVVPRFFSVRVPFGVLPIPPKLMASCQVISFPHTESALS
jgi:hypothetical protein